MRNLANRLSKLEEVSVPDYVEVMPLRWFYGDRDARPIRMTRQEFLKRTLDDFYREEAQA